MSFGLGDTIDGTFNNENPGSFDHWMNSAFLALLGYKVMHKVALPEADYIHVGNNPKTASVYPGTASGDLFIDGELFEVSIPLTEKSAVTAIAEVSIDGKSLTLNDIAIYSNIGDIPNQVGSSQFRATLKTIMGEAKAQGFETLHITGQRALRSTSANPGKTIDILIDLTD